MHIFLLCFFTLMIYLENHMNAFETSSFFVQLQSIPLCMYYNVIHILLLEQ